MSLFREDLEDLVNRYSKENGSNTPDFILANYLEACLISFDEAVKLRDIYYGGYSEDKDVVLAKSSNDTDKPGFEVHHSPSNPNGVSVTGDIPDFDWPEFG
jgi:hypothetical protein